MSRVERATLAYFTVASARANKKSTMTVSDALRILREAEQIINPERPIAGRIHELKYDIIEGNTKWREKVKSKQSKSGSNLIPLTIV